jgi:hypothetical protein
MNRAIQFCLLLTLCTSVALAVPQEKATRILVLKKEHKMELFSGDKIIKTYKLHSEEVDSHRSNGKATT